MVLTLRCGALSLGLGLDLGLGLGGRTQIMLGLAWATLPDLEEYRTGVIMVGLAR